MTKKDKAQVDRGELLCVLLRRRLAVALNSSTFLEIWPAFWTH